jgi:hypothetical protein
VAVGRGVLVGGINVEVAACCTTGVGVELEHAAPTQTNKHTVTTEAAN